MWLGEIDVPQVVLDAADEGTLVFFVGAGASRSHPSSLPDFLQLVAAIGARAGRDLTKKDKRQPDVFLGRLEDDGIDVHQLVADAIDQSESKANEVHTAIVGIAGASRVARVVTTNYDLHLTEAATSLGLDLKIYEAPALPVGDDFDGIVHLHGSLLQPSRYLVATDSDFGRAYLREAWAARFLERMFSAFTVVFVGYSHGDVVMQYLARSLGRDQNRYVLTDDGQNADWRRLGLTPIAYPNEAGDHAILSTSLERWRVVASMGRVEHRARIGELMAADPPTIPEEVSYLETVLAHPERVRYFVERAIFADEDRAKRWLAWIETRPVFSRIFSPASASAPSVQSLVAWLANHYVVREETSPGLLRAFRDSPWPRDTWSAVMSALVGVKGVFPNWLGPWLNLALQNAPSERLDLLDMVLSDKDWSENFDLALRVFEHRTRPLITSAFNFAGNDAPPRFEVRLAGDEYWLSEAWTQIILPVLAEHLSEVLELSTAQISRAYRTLRSLDPVHRFDSLSFSRSAIEPHEQDAHRGPIDVVIDAARDSIESAMATDVALGAGYLATWLASPNALLRRLAVHGWRVRQDLSVDEKVAWVLQGDLMWEVELQHEVFLLLRDALPNADGETARRLVEKAADGPPTDGPQEINDDGHNAYRAYNLLAWLEASAPDLAPVTRAFESAQAKHPEFQRREQPDLSHSMTSGFVEDALPFTAAELHGLIVDAPDSALERLREFRAQTHGLTGPTWTGALRSLRACVAAYPDDGLSVAVMLRSDDQEFKASIVQGWGTSVLADDQVEEIIATISGWDADEIRRPVAAMLSDGGGPDHPTDWHAYAAARALASRLWPAETTEAAISGGADLLAEAINHPAGDLAEFWTKAVQWEWTQNEAAWEGIPTEIGLALDVMVWAPDRNGLLARSYLASQLHFYFGADREWCQTRLLPLFAWTNEPDSAAAWQGFLAWGRWNDALLQAGLLEAYIATTARIEDLPNDLARQLALHLASVATHAAADPGKWLTNFVLTAAPDLRVLWAKQVGRTLCDLDHAESTRQWERWIHEYWAGRVQSVPLPFTVAEASATAGWAMGLPNERDQVADLVLGSTASLDDQHGFLHRLSQMDLVGDAGAWARILTHLMKNTRSGNWGVGYFLEKIVPELRAGDPEPDLSELVDQAMRLGATNAADW